MYVNECGLEAWLSVSPYSLVPGRYYYRLQSQNRGLLQFNFPPFCSVAVEPLSPPRLYPPSPPYAFVAQCSAQASTPTGMNITEKLKIRQICIKQDHFNKFLNEKSTLLMQKYI